MGDAPKPRKGEPGPDSTLVDPEESSASTTLPAPAVTPAAPAPPIDPAPTPITPHRATRTGQVPGTVSSGPVGKRPTRSIPIQAAEASAAPPPAESPRPSVPGTRRPTGAKHAAPLESLSEPDTNVNPVPVVARRLPEHELQPATNVQPKLEREPTAAELDERHPPADLVEPDTTLNPMPDTVSGRRPQMMKVSDDADVDTGPTGEVVTAPDSLPPKVVDPDTRLTTMPTVATEKNLPPAPERRHRLGAEPGGDTGKIAAPSLDRTHDFKPLGPTATFAGLDEQTFRRALWGLAAGGFAVLVLITVLIYLKAEAPPEERGAAVPIAHEPEKKPKDTVEPVVVAPKQVTIEQTVDAGNGETRTVLAAAGTVRIVTDPDTNVFLGEKDLGPAPVLVTLPAGRNTLVLENKALFFKRTVNVDVLPNEQTAVRFAYSRGWIEIDAPPGAKVTVDGRPATGNHVQVWEGSHKVEIVHANKQHTRSAQLADVNAGATTSVHFDAPSIADE